MKKVILTLTMLSILSSCTGVQHCILTSQSIKSDKCFDQIKNGIVTILNDNGVNYTPTNKDMGEIKNEGGLILSFPTTSLSEYNGMTFYFIINDPKSPKVTLFKLEKGSKTIIKTTKNGIKSIDIDNCTYNLKN